MVNDEYEKAQGRLAVAFSSIRKGVKAARAGVEFEVPALGQMT